MCNQAVTTKLHDLHSLVVSAVPHENHSILFHFSNDVRVDLIAVSVSLFHKLAL